MSQKNELYQTYVKNKLIPYSSNHELLNIHLIDLKILAMLYDLAMVANDAKVFSFWDKSPVESEALRENYLNGLKTLIALGYEIKVDRLKNFQEIPEETALSDLFFRLYQDIFKIKQNYSFADYENTFDDYLALGFTLGFDLETITAALNGQ
ncbi:MAG: dUTP diphosphatase [Erysipelotrichaceae bacterium]|nr:dUTP diphosphatase [Erysipelotrichaceae bacterium]MDD3809353.1 dUTP diphosphatase [Erysipelotrichaceae bacterium]